MTTPEDTTYDYGDRVRVMADPMRNGRYAGRIGTIASNTLAGTVWVHLGMQYSNFHASDLEAAPS